MAKIKSILCGAFSFLLLLFVSMYRTKLLVNNLFIGFTAKIP